MDTKQGRRNRNHFITTMIATAGTECKLLMRMKTVRIVWFVIMVFR